MASLGRGLVRGGVGVVFAMFAAFTGVPGVAGADAAAVLGPGSGVLISTDDPDLYAACSLTAAGFDGAGRMVGITAGHCGYVGDSVWAEGALGIGKVGRIAEVDDYWDWAVIEFEGAKVVPVRQITRSVVNGIGGRPRVFDTVCKNGRTTGYTCGVVWENIPEGFSSHVCADYGDSGAPVLLGDQLVGMIVAGAPATIGSVDLELKSCSNPADLIHEPDLATDIDIVMTDINQHGGVGAGFRLP
ncbi:S1 family peptidase [Nocardia sp. NPDC051030]|uniref:S1 family peptidase n=1 Tax=Nocardia sp. NPDC051030 TaxID=3155162 RepID=UPI0034286075